jgi:ABC-type glycerol-3-phosphate transport system substrate-binding protein
MPLRAHAWFNSGNVLMGLLLGAVGLMCWQIPRDAQARRQHRTADGRIIVSYWEKWTGFEQEAMQAVVDDFNASQATYFVKMLAVSEIDRKMMLATAGGNPPDVAGIWSSGIHVFAEKGALTPLDTMLAAAGIHDGDYVPVYWAMCRHRGFTWALPSTPTSLALHWNRQLFVAAGLDPERPPSTLAELDRMAERLTVVELVRDRQAVRLPYAELTKAEQEAKAFVILQLGFSPFEPGWWTAYWPYWFGGELWDGDRRLTTTSPEVVAAFAWFRSYAEKYGVENLRRFGSSFGNFSSPQNPFLSGQVAMVLQGVWMHNFIEKYAPQLSWGAAPFPGTGPAGGDPVTLVESDVLVIPRGARERAGAMAFIAHVQRPATMERLCLGQRKSSPLAAVSADFLARHPHPHIGMFMALARSPRARFVPQMPVMNEYADELTVAADQVYSLRETPTVALARVAARIQPKLTQAGERWDRVGPARMEAWRHDDAR